jgi:hypothetical protein
MSQLAFAIFRNDFTFQNDHADRTQYFLHGVIISYRIRQDGLPLSYPYDKYSYGGRKLIWLSYDGGNGYQRKNGLYYHPIDKRVHLTTCSGFDLTKQNLEELRKGYVVTQKPNETWHEENFQLPAKLFVSIVIRNDFAWTPIKRLFDR